MKRFITILFALIAICLGTNAQKFYYEGGYFEKNGDKWYEYKPTEKDGVWNSFTEVDNQEYFYVIDNGLCQVAVPKSPDNNFLIKLKGQSEWQFKYKSVRTGQTALTSTSSIHSRIVALVEQQNEYYKKNVVEYNGVRIKPIKIGSESEKLVTFEFDIKDNIYNYTNHELKQWRNKMRKASIKILKAQATTDEMTRLMIQGNYTFRYIYYDKRGKVMHDFTIKADDLK